VRERERVDEEENPYKEKLYEEKQEGEQHHRQNEEGHINNPLATGSAPPNPIIFCHLSSSSVIISLPERSGLRPHRSSAAC